MKKLAKDNVKLPTHKKGTPQNMNQNVIDDELNFHAGRNKRKKKKKSSTAKGKEHYTNSQVTNIQSKIQENTTENRLPKKNHLLEENRTIMKAPTISNEGNKKNTGEQYRPDLKEVRREPLLSHQRSPEEQKREITDKSAETNPVRPSYSVNSNVKDAQRAYEERILHKSEPSISVSVPDSKVSNADKALMLSREKNETAHHEQWNNTSSILDSGNNNIGRSSDDSGSLKKAEKYLRETFANSELFHQPSETITRETDLSVIGKSNVADAQRAYEESINQQKKSSAESDLKISKSPEPIRINTGYGANESYHAESYESERSSDVNSTVSKERHHHSSGSVDGSKKRSEHEQDLKIRFEKPSSYKEQTEDRQVTVDDGSRRMQEINPADSKPSPAEYRHLEPEHTGKAVEYTKSMDAPVRSSAHNQSRMQRPSQVKQPYTQDSYHTLEKDEHKEQRQSFFCSNVKDAQRAFEERQFRKPSADTPVRSHDQIVEYTDRQATVDDGSRRIQETGSADSKLSPAEYRHLEPEHTGKAAEYTRHMDSPVRTSDINQTRMDRTHQMLPPFAQDSYRTLEKDEHKEQRQSFSFGSNIKDAQRAFEESQFQKTSAVIPVRSHDRIVEYTDRQVVVDGSSNSRIQETGSIDIKPSPVEHHLLKPEYTVKTVEYTESMDSPVRPSAQNQSRIESPSQVKQSNTQGTYHTLEKDDHKKPRQSFSFSSNVKDAQRNFEESLLQKPSKNSPVSSHDHIVEHTDKQVAYESSSKIQESGAFDSRKQSADYQRVNPLQPGNPLRTTEISPNVTQESQTDFLELKEGSYSAKLTRNSENLDQKGIQPSNLFGNNSKHAFDETLFLKTRDTEQKEISVSIGSQTGENTSLDGKNTRLQEPGYAERADHISANSHMTLEKTSSAIERTKEQLLGHPERSNQQSIRKQSHLLESDKTTKAIPADMQRKQVMYSQRLFEDDMIQPPKGLSLENSILHQENKHSLDGRESKLKESGIIERMAQSDVNSIVDLKMPSKGTDNQGNMNQAFDENKSGLSENHPTFLKEVLNQKLQDGTIPSAQPIITINRNVKDAQRAFQENTLSRPKFQEQFIFPVYDNENQETLSVEPNHKLSDTEQNKIFLESGETIPISSRKQGVPKTPMGHVLLKGGAVDESLPGERERLLNDQNRHLQKDVSEPRLHGNIHPISEKFEEPDLQELSYTEQPGIVQGHLSHDVPPLINGMDEEDKLSRGISKREERGLIKNTGKISDHADVLNHSLHKDTSILEKNLFVGNVQDAQQAYKDSLIKKGIRPSLLADAYAPGVIPGFTDPLSDDKTSVLPDSDATDILSSASTGLDMGVFGKKDASVDGTKLSNPVMERLNNSLHDTVSGQLDEPIDASSFIGVSKKQGLVNADKTRGIGLADNRNLTAAARISPNTYHLLTSEKKMFLAERRKKLVGMFSNRAIRMEELNANLMESSDLSYEGIEPLLSDDDDPNTIAATRDKPSRLHVDDIITIPTKLTIYMAYQITTNGTYENTGIHTTASVYVPTAIFAANTALKWLSNGAVKNYLQSNAFREIKQVLVFDSQSAAGDIRNLLLRYGINNEDKIQKALDVISGDNFIPGRDMSLLYNSMDLSNVVNPQTGNLFTPAEISDFRHELLTIINSNTPDVEGINPETLMNLKDRKGLLEQQKMINQYLRKHLLTGTRNRGLGNLAGTVSVRQLRNLLKRTDLTAEEIAVIKHALKLHAAIKTSEMSHKKLGITRNIRRHARKLLINTHVGSGAFLLLDLVRMTTRTLKYTMRSAAQMGKGIKYGLALASRPIRSAALMVNRAIRINPVIDHAMTGYVDPVVNRVRNVVDHASDTVRNVHTRRSHIRQRARNFSRETRKFFRDPFRIRERTMSRLAKTKAGKAVKKATAPVKNIVNMVRAAIAKVVATIAAVVSTILSLLSGILIVLLLILLLFVIIYFLIATFMNMFTLNADASDSDTAILNRCIETINSMYENQMSSINSITNGGRYRNVTVNIRQVKDEEEYSNNDSDSEGSNIYAYTNSREILSMAKVYFDFDLDGASETEVLNYVKQLYNGSHTYYVTETPVYAEDDEGNSYIAEYDATIDYTTYYFNAIFNCQLLNDSYGGSAILGSDISGGVVAEQMWNYFKSAGWSDAACAAALGNAAQESGGTLISGINPAAHGSGGRGVFGFTYSPDSKKSDDGMGLVRYAESQGTDWTDLKTQLDYFVLCQQGVWGSMWNSNSQTAKEFRNAGYTVPACSFEQFTQLHDVNQATMVFLCAYENCGIRNARWETRSREANKAYSLYAGTTAESSPEEES